MATKSKTGKTSRVKVRRNSIKGLHKYKIIEGFISGKSYKELAEEFNTSDKNIIRIISEHWKVLTNTRETKLLVDSQKNINNHVFTSPIYKTLKDIHEVSKINEKFLDALSEDTSTVLTDAEYTFCYRYVNTGDAIEALKDAGLDVGLLRFQGSKRADTTLAALRLRADYLKSKPNVAQYISELKKQAFDEEVVSKEFIQRELLEELHRIKESDRLPAATKHSLTLKTLDKLGKTVGAFAEIMRVEEVDPAAALDELEKLREADVRSVVKSIEYTSDA